MTQILSESFSRFIIFRRNKNQYKQFIYRLKLYTYYSYNCQDKSVV